MKISNYINCVIDNNYIKLKDNCGTVQHLTDIMEDVHKYMLYGSVQEKKKSIVLCNVVHTNTIVAHGYNYNIH